MKRAIERTKLSKEMNVELVEIMWNQFAKMDNYESFVITTTDYSINETTSIVKKHIREKSHLLI